MPPAGTSSDSQPATESYVLQAVEKCEAHGNSHRDGGQPKKEVCISVLNKIKSMLPKLCQNNFSPSVSSVSEVMGMCKLFNLILSKRMCVYAGAVFDNGDLKAVAPCLFTVWQLLLQPEFADAHESLMEMMELLLALAHERSLEAYACLFGDMVLLLEDGQELLRRVLEHGWPRPAAGKDKEGKDKVAQVQLLAFQRTVRLSNDDGQNPALLSASGSESSEEGIIIRFHSPQSILRLIMVDIRALSRVITTNCQSVASVPAFQRLGRALAAQICLFTDPRLPLVPCLERHPASGGDSAGAVQQQHLVQLVQSKTVEGLEQFIGCRQFPPEFIQAELILSILTFFQHQEKCPPSSLHSKEPGVTKQLLRSLIHLMRPTAACRPFSCVVFQQVVAQLVNTLTSGLSLVMKSELEQGSESIVMHPSYRALCATLFWAFRRIIVEWPPSVWHLAVLVEKQPSPQTTMDGTCASDLTLCFYLAILRGPDVAQEVVRGWVAASGDQSQLKRSSEVAGLVSKHEGGAKKAKEAHLAPTINGRKEGGDVVPAAEESEMEVEVRVDLPRSQGALATILQGILQRCSLALADLKTLSSESGRATADEWVHQVAQAVARAYLGLLVLAYALSTVEHTHETDKHSQWFARAVNVLVDRATAVMDAFPIGHLDVALLHTAIPHYLLDLALACMSLLPLHTAEVAALERVREMVGKLGGTAIEWLSRKQFVDVLLSDLERCSSDIRLDLVEASDMSVLGAAQHVSALEKVLMVACCGGPLLVSRSSSGSSSEIPACLWSFLPDAVSRAARESLVKAPLLARVLSLLVGPSIAPRPLQLMVLRYLPVLLETLLFDLPDLRRHAAALAALSLAAGRQLLSSFKGDKEVIVSTCQAMHDCIMVAFFSDGATKEVSRVRCKYHKPHPLGEEEDEEESDEQQEQRMEAFVGGLPSQHLEALVVVSMGFSSLLNPGNSARIRLHAAKMIMLVFTCVPRSTLLSEKPGGAAAPVPKVLLNFLKDADASVREFMANRLDCFIRNKAALAQFLLKNWSSHGPEGKGEEIMFNEAINVLKQELEDLQQHLEGKLETSNSAPQLYMDFVKGLGTLAIRCPNQSRYYEIFFLWAVISLVRIWGKRNICCSVAFEQLYRISRTSRLNLEQSLARQAESCFLPLYKTLIEGDLLQAFVGEVLAECCSMDTFLECSLKFVITGATLKQDLPFLEKVATVWDRYLGPGSTAEHRHQVQQDDAEEVRRRTPLWGMLVAYASPVVARLFLADPSAVGWYYKQIPGHTLTGTKIQGMFCEVAWEMAESECNGHEDRRVAALTALKALAALTEMKERGDDPLDGMTQVEEWGHDSDVAKYVENNFLYVLSKVVLTIDWRRRPMHTNLVAMTLLRQLLQLMPRQCLSAVFPKVMVVMNVMLEEGGVVGVDGQGGGPEVHARACETLATFVRMLSDEDLLTNMAVIVVTIIPAVTPGDGSELGSGGGGAAEPVPESGHRVRSREILLDLLNWLIVTKQRSLSEAFVGIPFLPSIPELKQANDVLAEHVPSASQLPAQLKRLIPLLSHDSAPVRLQTLKQLHRVLSGGRRHLFDLIAGSDVAEDVVSELLTSLLRLRMDADPAHRLTCCACLGELGAIDPARVAVNLFTKGEPGSQGWSPALVAPWTITDSSLALTLLRDMLVPTIRAATKDHDRFPFAIQEILKLLYKRGQSRLLESSSSDGGDMGSTQVEVDEKERRAKPMPSWLQEALGEAQVLNVVNPFWTTNYVVHKQGQPSKPPFLVGGSSGQSFRNRLGTFCLYLIDVSRGPFYELFYACRGIVRPHEALKNFLLPYLVVDAWCYGDDHIKEVLMAEIMSVLEPGHGASGEGGRQGVSNNTTTSDPVAIQAMLSLIDTLMDWTVSSRRAAELAAQRRRKMNPQAAEGDDDAAAALSTSAEGVWRPMFEEVGGLLTLIPRMLLVRASLRIRAYTRALKYLEQHVRETRKDPQDLPRHMAVISGASQGGIGTQASAVSDHLPTVSQLSMGNDGANNTLPMLESSEVDMFQLIFSRLDEPDSMCGLAAVRRKASKPKTLRQRIREYEHDEDWGSALQGYEQAMLALRVEEDTMVVEEEPKPKKDKEAAAEDAADGDEETSIKEKKGEVAKGMLQSLIELDQVDSALNLFMAMVSREADLRQPLLPAGIEACWRLQRWPTLKDLGTDAFEARFDDPDERFQVALGKVVLSLNDHDTSGMATALKLARNEAMASLSAASMESYQRAYPSLVKLHILHELEQGHELLEVAAKAAAEEGSDGTPQDGSRVLEAIKGQLDELGWDNRLAVMRTSARQSAPVLAARRAIFQMAGLRGLTAETWLTQAARATDAGCFRLAESALRQAACWGLNGERLTLQEAKLLQAQDRVHEALLLLEPVEVDVMKLSDYMAEVVRSAAGSVAEAHREQAATRLLLTTNWMVEAKVKHGQQVLDRYNLTTTLLPRSEACFFSLASYYDFLLDARAKEVSRDSNNSSSNNMEKALGEDQLYQTYLRHTIESYAASLHNGLEHIFQSMPRLITLCGLVQGLIESTGGSSSFSRNTRNGSTNHLYKTQQDCHTHVNKAIRHVPSYAWYTCLPQLLSQLGSTVPSSSDLRTLILNAVIKVLSSHPEQAVWSITGLGQSKDPQRKRLGDKILSSACMKLREQSHECQAVMLEQSKSLFQQLILLAQGDDHPESANQEKKITHLKIAIGKKLSLPSFHVPLQAALTVSLPRSSLSTKHRRGLPGVPSSSATHYPSDDWYDAFPNSQLHIRVFTDSAQVLHSKAKPKKVQLITTCERRITFLCKQEKSGDLRKDARIMEFNGLVNRLLQRDAEGRRRNLRLRTYAVVCLNEECGLIEWVPLTQCLRNCITDSQKLSGVYKNLLPFKEVRAHIERMQVEHEKDVPTMAKEYKELVANHYPPTLHHWFLAHYAEPTAWFEARTAFTRSAAVWSAVGHVIGLGDRHGENILVDTAGGELVHVDFDCLFDKGLHLQRPELVPFRLTPNMVDAMGVTGYEGIFRRVMEVTLVVLREHRQTLSSVLEPFVNDSAVHWDHTKAGRGSTTGADGSISPLLLLEERLRGIYILRIPQRPRRKHLGRGTAAAAAQSAAQQLSSNNNNNNKQADVALPLSVPGQVQKLIHEATAMENLAQMYIGWMPFL